MNGGIKLELLLVFLLHLLSKCYVGWHEYPYECFKPTTKINTVIKTELCVWYVNL